jgi:hypothetical protein
MTVLQQEIVKLLANGAMTAGAIRSELNSQQWDVSQSDVLGALHKLENEFAVECLWGLK